ncbi:unnamed protein product [Schistosoma turkestanicum]|nr:unnamed protein product [Schistosoma turkestanicum]
MSSVLKSKILKPFLRFTKNLSSNKLHMSILKGVLELETLELEENALMELLDLPTWLLLRKAFCTNVVAKIHWTKLKTHPVLISIDHVKIELQALDEPRPASQSPIANYRGGSGKYGFSDKVIDGVTIQVNSVFIEFFAQAFQGSVELSRFCVLSKSPNWRSCLLNLSTLTLPQYDSILIFKEVSWESARIVADGLLTELRGTPVKLITNQSRVRLTMKKRLSDGSLISSRIHLILDDLLWIFTLSQVEAAIVFARSLEHSIRLANEQSKRFAAEKAKVSRFKNSSLRFYVLPELTWPNCHEFYQARDHWLKGIHPIHFTYNNGKLFNTHRISSMPTTTTPTDNQSILLDYNLLQTMNTTILQSVGYFRLIDLIVSCVSYPKSSSSLLKRDNNNSSSTAFSKFAKINKGLHTTHSNINNSNNSNSNNKNHARIQAEIPIDKNIFIGSDKLLHNLPVTSSFLTVELKNYYHCSSSTATTTSTDDATNSKCSNQSLPCSLFCQINPFHINFDPDTVIWLNAFLLTLQLNLSTFLSGRDQSNPSDKQLNSWFDLNRYHVRVEALMPRLIFSSLFGPSNRYMNSSNWIGPHALVLQSDQIIIQSLAAPISLNIADCLKQLLNNLHSNSNQYATSMNHHHHNHHHHPFNARSIPRKSVNLFKFQQLAESATELHSLYPNFEEQFWCIHCPNVWSEFLTLIDMVTNSSDQHDHNHINDFMLYRQSFIESFPLTIWSLIPINNSDNNNNQPSVQSPISILIDIDNKFIPMDDSQSPANSTQMMINNDQSSIDQCPIKVALGSIDHLSTNSHLFTYLINQSDRNEETLKIIPDLFHQIVLLFYIVEQISYVQTHFAIDYQEFLLMTKNQQQQSSLLTHHASSPPVINNDVSLLYCIQFSTFRSIELNVNYFCHENKLLSDQIPTESILSTCLNENNHNNTNNSNNDNNSNNTDHHPNIDMNQNVFVENVSYFPKKSLSTTSLTASSPSSVGSLTKFSHFSTPSPTTTTGTIGGGNGCCESVALSSQPTPLPRLLRHHHSMLTPSLDTLSLKTGGSFVLNSNISSSKSSIINFRKSMRGRIHSSEDRQQSTFYYNDCHFNSSIGIIENNKNSNNNNNNNKYMNKLINSNSLSPKIFLKKYRNRSIVPPSVNNNDKNECNPVVNGDKQSQNTPLSENNLPLTFNSVVDDVLLNNSSTNHMNHQFSISSDLSDLQSISGSTDDWTKPYEALSDVKTSCTNKNDDLFLLPLHHQHSFNSSSLLLGPDEIGSELSDVDVFTPPGTLNSPTTTTNTMTTTIDLTTASASAANEQAKSQENTTDYERFYQWKKLNLSSVIIQLTGFSCEADATNLESRFWIVFKSLQLFTKHEESLDCCITSPFSPTHIDLNQTPQHQKCLQSNYLWSIFLSFGGDPTISAGGGGGGDLGEFNPSTITNTNYPWVYINAILLKNWQLIIPLKIEQIFTHIRHQIDSINQLNSSVILNSIPSDRVDNNNNNNNSSSLPRCFIRLLLKQGNLSMKLHSENVDENVGQLKLLKQLFLQQGLIIELNEHGVFQIAIDQYPMNAEPIHHTINDHHNAANHDNSQLLSDSSSSPQINTTNSFHNILINRYAAENKLLKDKIEALTNELMQLKSTTHHNVQYSSTN